MKTIETKLNGKFDITEEQYQALSYYATLICFENTQEKLNYIRGMEAILGFIVPWQLTYDISIEKRFSQYRNMNKFTYIVNLPEKEVINQ